MTSSRKSTTQSRNLPTFVTPELTSRNLRMQTADIRATIKKKESPSNTPRQSDLYFRNRKANALHNETNSWHYRLPWGIDRVFAMGLWCTQRYSYIDQSRTAPRTDHQCPLCRHHCHYHRGHRYRLLRHCHERHRPRRHRCRSRRRRRI